MKIAGAHLEVLDSPTVFENRFFGVWACLPPRAKDDLERFWSTRRRSGLQYTNTIKFAEQLPRNADGITSSNGRLLQFRRGVFETIDSKFSEEVVAHELAHVYDWAVGAASRFNDADVDRPEIELQMECDAIRTAGDWEFSLPGNRSVDQHLLMTAAAILTEMPLDVFPEGDPSRVSLREAIRLGDQIASWRCT